MEVVDTNSHVTFLITIGFVIMGWYVLFNSAKHISTRSEARTIVNDLILIIKEQNKTTIDYWSEYNTIEKQKNSLYQKNAVFFISMIRQYENTLKKYNLVTFEVDGIELLKRALTESPDHETRNDDEILSSFRYRKVVEVTGLSQKVIKKIHNEYSEKYIPVTTPVLSKIETVFWFSFKVAILFLIFSLLT